MDTVVPASGAMPADVSKGNGKPRRHLPRSKSLVLNDDELAEVDVHSCINKMQQAVSMVKVKGQGHMITRSFYLDQDKTSIRWKPSRKVDAKIPIDCIREIRQGASTDVFLKCQDGMFDSSCCFSIIYGNQCDVLDLVARQQEDATVWTVGLKYLMAGMSEEESHTQQQRLRDQWLKSTFKSADKSGDGLLSIGEVIMLLHRLNVNLSKRKVRQMFKEADTNITDQNEGLLDFDEFVSFYKRISTRKEIYMLLLRYGNGKEYLTAAELAHFLETEQTMASVSLRYCLDVIKNFEPVPDNAKNGWLGIDGFSRYLLSREGDIFNPIHSKVHQDMTRPLSHYYIAASHNTYLLGDQLLSKSSMDVYAFVLQNGCRCVEVDCWDGPDGEPMVYHGYTLTSKIPFKNVIQTINKYAFTSSPYPLIVSVENHCCLEQQKIMASYMKEIFGDHLNIDPPDRHARYLPSPEQLKYKILIKAKKLPPGLDERIESGEVSDEDSADEMEEQFKVKDSLRYKQVECFAKAKLASLARESASPTRRINFKFPRKSPSKRSRSKSFSEGAMDPETAHYLHQQSNLVEEPKRRTSLSASFGKLKLSKKKRQSLPGLDPMYVHSEEMTPEYSTSAKIEHGKLKFKTRRASEVALQSKLRRNSDTSSASSKENLDTIGQQRRRVSICTRKNTVMLSRHLSDLVKYTMSVGFNDFTYNTPCWELPSFGESKAFQLALNRGQQFTHFNKRKLSRCYPAAYRIDSSNYNPVPMWNCGIQLVALNYQTDGRAMQLNNAKFSTNGQCGFVLKPEVLCDEKSMFDPHTTEPIPGVLRKQLIIRIQSGQQLPKPPQSILGERGEIIDPYVEVEIIGIPIDCARRQTRTIQDNGFNPVWDETMVFTINLPELALVRIVVWDEDPIGRDFIGQKTLPFTSMLPGYRHIRLEGLNEASIFVHITINDFSDKIKNKANRKRNILSKTGRQTTLEAPERVSLRKKSFTSKLRRQSSVPNMPSSSRRPRDAPAIHGIRTENNNADKGISKKKTVTFVTPVSYVLPRVVKAWLDENTNRNIGPVEIQMILRFMTISQLLTAVREGQLCINVVGYDPIPHKKQLYIKHLQAPPCYTEAVKRSLLYRKRGFHGLKPHIRYELSSSLSSMSSTILPDTSTDRDSLDSSSVASTNSSSHDMMDTKHVKGTSYRNGGYMPVRDVTNSYPKRSVKTTKKKKYIKSQHINQSQSSLSRPFSLCHEIDRTNETMRPDVMDAASALLMLHGAENREVFPRDVNTFCDEEMECSSTSEYRETDTISELTTSSESSSEDERNQPTYQTIMKTIAMNNPVSKYDEDVMRDDIDSADIGKSTTCDFLIDSESSSNQTTSRNSRSASHSTKYTDLQIISDQDKYIDKQEIKTTHHLLNPKQTPKSKCINIQGEKHKSIRPSTNSMTVFAVLSKPNKFVGATEVKYANSDAKPEEKQYREKQNEPTNLEVVSPDISMDVTSNDHIWSSNLSTCSSSDSGEGFYSDYSPNVTLERPAKSAKTVSNKARHDSTKGLLIKIQHNTARRIKHEQGKEKAKRYVAGHSNTDTNQFGNVYANHNGNLPHSNLNGRDDKEMKLRTDNQIHTAHCGTSSDVSKDDTTTHKIKMSQSVSISVDCNSDSSCDGHSTTSSSSVETVVDMSLECLGKCTPKTSTVIPAKKANSLSLDNLTLRQIFNQSEYQSFMENMSKSNHKDCSKNNKFRNDNEPQTRKLDKKLGPKHYEAILKRSTSSFNKNKSASTTSVADQLKMLTSMDDDFAVAAEKIHQIDCFSNEDKTINSSQSNTRTDCLDNGIGQKVGVNKHAVLLEYTPQLSKTKTKTTPASETMSKRSKLSQSLSHLTDFKMPLLTRKKTENVDGYLSDETWQQKRCEPKKDTRSSVFHVQRFGAAVFALVKTQSNN